MKVYLPSYNRAGKTITERLIPKEHLRIVCWEDQYEEYKEHYDRSNLIVCPDREYKTLGSITNFILDIIEDDDGYGIVADDDINRIIHIPTGEDVKGKRLLNVYCNLFEIAYGIGAHFVGLNNSNDKLKYRGDFHPFSLTKPFYTIVGVIPSDGVRYEYRYPKGEDVDFYFKQMHKHHKVVRDNRFYPQVEKGNLSTGRGLKISEWKEHYIRLQKKWGRKYIRLNDDYTVKGVSSPIKGI